jgi:hypothetical protein
MNNSFVFDKKVRKIATWMFISSSVIAPLLI